VAPLRKWGVPLAVFLLALAALVYLENHDNVLNFVESTRKDLRTGLNLLLVVAFTGVTTTIGNYFKTTPEEDDAEIPPAPQTPAIEEIKNKGTAPAAANVAGTAVPPVDWHRRYDDLYREASEKIRRANQLLGTANDAAESTRAAHETDRRRLAELSERHAALKYALYCGLTMGAASFVATVIFHPYDGFSRHILALNVLYCAVSLFFGMYLGYTPKQPNYRIALRVAGLAAFYVNVCATLIALVYVKDRLWGATAGNLRGVPIGYVIIVVWLIVLPLASIVFCWIGNLIMGQRQPIIAG
jgi:hypothetical protein